MEDLPFRALWYPYGAYLALVVNAALNPRLSRSLIYICFWQSNVFLCAFQGYTTLSPFSAPDFIDRKSVV